MFNHEHGESRKVYLLMGDRQQICDKIQPRDVRNPRLNKRKTIPLGKFPPTWNLIFYGWRTERRDLDKSERCNLSLVCGEVVCCFGKQSIVTLSLWKEKGNAKMQSETQKQQQQKSKKISEIF